MNNLDIIKQFQTKYNDMEKDTLISYLYSLIKTEFLKYNKNENYLVIILKKFYMEEKSEKTN